MNFHIITYEGLRLKQVKRWVLKCESCFKYLSLNKIRVINDTSKLFCPQCGNSSLMRISMIISKKGTIHYGNLPSRINLRGAKVFTKPLQ